MVRTAAREGRAGASSAPDSVLLLVLPAADEPDEPRLGAASGVRARVGEALVGGGDPPQQPELVAGGRRRREHRALGSGRARAAVTLQPRGGTPFCTQGAIPDTRRDGPAQHSAAQTRVSFRAETFQPCPPHHPAVQTCLCPVQGLLSLRRRFCTGTGQNGATDILEQDSTLRNARAQNFQFHSSIQVGFGVFCYATLTMWSLESENRTGL